MTEIFDAIRKILFMAPQIIVIVVSFQYLRKTRSLDAKLLFAGAMLAIIIAYIFKFLYTDLYSDADFDDMDLTKLERLVLIQNILNCIITLVFIAGFYMSIQKYLKKLKSRK